MTPMWNPDDWLNIPIELQARPQWMVCKGMEDKRPLTLSGYPGDPTDINDWSSFADAYMLAAQQHLYIGFCLSANDPYTIVDMDNKSQDPAYFDMIRDTYDQLDTYIERSISGLGMHAILQGDIGPGRKRAPFELYSRERFMIMTGDVVKASPISGAYQNMLNQAADWCGPGSEHELALIDWTSPPTEEELYYDNIALQWFSNFSNVAKIERWFNGSDCEDPTYTQRSEDDARLMQLYYKFNKGRPERDRATVRMFLRSPRATHYLMRKTDWQQYVARTLGFVRNMVDAEELRVVQMQQLAGAFPVADHMKMGVTAIKGNVVEIGKVATSIFFTASELLTRADVPWVVHNLLPVGGLAAIYGESGAGKSFIALDMIGAIALGEKWFRKEVRQLPVCCLALEGSGGLKKRVLAWQQAHKQTFPESVLFYDGAFSLRADSGGAAMAFLPPNRVNQITQFCQALNATQGGKFGGVVFVDTLNQASEGANENDSRDMNQLIQGAKLIQQSTGSLVVLVHHATKSPENQSMRGHGSFKAACDAVIEVYTQMDADGKITGRGWTAEKVKDWESGAKGAFMLKGEFGTNSVAIHELWEQQEIHDDATGETYVEEKPVEVHKGKAKGGAHAGANGHSRNGSGNPWQNDTPMGGAKSERDFRVSKNEHMFNEQWPDLVKKHGQVVQCSKGARAVQFDIVVEHMIAFIAGIKRSTKETTLNNVFQRLQSRGQLFCAPDESGQQWLWR